MANKKILISGATGFIGKELVAKFLDNGFNVTAVNRKEQHINHPGYSQVIYDGSYDSLPQGESFDGIIHLATLYLNKHSTDDIPALINANILLGTQLLDYAANNNIGFFINTASFSQSITGDGYMPQSLYAATKQAMEDIALFYHSSGKTRVLTIELFDTYGESDIRTKFLKLAIDAYKSNSVFKMSKGEQEINYTYIDDVVAGFIEAVNLMSNGFEGGKYSINSETTMPLFELVTLIGDIYGKKIEIERGFYPYRAGEIMKIVKRYPTIPNWKEKVGLREGLKKMLEF